MSVEILTVGHSTHPLERFLELLSANQVTAIADVRSTPYSRRHPQFNREPLHDALQASGIEYVFLGRELGARSEDDACYENDTVRYDRLARTEAFASGIDRLMAGARKYRIALLCAEHEPLECHRTILVARHLAGAGARIGHILRDGSLEPNERTVERLIAKLPRRLRDAPDGQLDLGDSAANSPGDGDAREAVSSATLVDRAYARQGERIAYRRPARGFAQKPTGA